MKKQIFASLITGIMIAPSAQSAAIDLTAWTQAGAASSGNWSVAPDGNSVTQTINGQPTYLISDQVYLNNDFDGSFKVQTTSDDDFIGFVFGWTGINDYYLFDWKQGTQAYTGTAQEGFTLSHVTGSDVNFWDHSGTDIAVLDTQYGSTEGWADNTLYDFKLTYTENSFAIGIDGNEIFSQTGSYGAGNFGFYNYSQGNVFYQGFEETQVSPVPEPPAYLLMMLGVLGLLARNKFTKQSS